MGNIGAVRISLIIATLSRNTRGSWSWWWRTGIIIRPESFCQVLADPRFVVSGGSARPWLFLKLGGARHRGRREAWNIHTCRTHAVKRVRSKAGNPSIVIITYQLWYLVGGTILVCLWKRGWRNRERFVPNSVSIHIRFSKVRPRRTQEKRLLLSFGGEGTRNRSVAWSCRVNSQNFAIPHSAIRSVIALRQSEFKWPDWQDIKGLKVNNRIRKLQRSSGFQD